MEDSEILKLFQNLVLGRGVLNPIQKNPFSIYNETFFETELRKVSREMGNPTATSLSSTKRGNLNRSTVLLSKNSPLFTNVGYGIVNPSINDILSVGICNNGTGEGKKNDIMRFIQPVETIAKNLEILKSMMNKGNKFDETSEIIVNIYNDKKIQFVYFNSDSDSELISTENSNINTSILQSVYLKDKFNSFLKKDLPILEYSEKTEIPKLFNYDYTTIISLIGSLHYSDKNFFTNPENINYLNHFSEPIKNSNLIDLFIKILTDQYEYKMRNDPNDFNDFYLDLNLGKTLKKFSLDNKSDLLLQKTLDRLKEDMSYLNSNLFNSFHLLGEIKNQDFRYQQNLHKQDISLFSFDSSNNNKVSSYLERFSNQVTEDVLEIALSNTLNQINKKLLNNKSISSNSMKKLMKEGLYQVKHLF